MFLFYFFCIFTATTKNQYNNMNTQKKFAVVLAGCGRFDGAEIHEATLTLLAIAKHRCTYEVFAPDVTQYHVVNHITGEVMKEDRNVLIESARIARGQVLPLSAFNANDFDAIIFPGGFGVAKNLFTFAFDGIEARVNGDVEKAVKEMFEIKKPIGALCIAPVLIAKILGNVEITIGSDPSTIENVKKMGATHITSTHGEVVSDLKNKIFTTPCYMLDATILQIEEGTYNIIKTMLEHMQ